MSESFSRQIGNTVEQLQKLQEQLEASALFADLPPSHQFALSLTLEELVSNVITHCEGRHTICCDIAWDGTDLVITLKDDGPEFNPWEMPPPPEEENLEEIKIGGRGIFMVKQTMDRCTYERTKGWNILQMTKHNSEKLAGCIE